MSGDLDATEDAMSTIRLQEHRVQFAKPLEPPSSRRETRAGRRDNPPVPTAVRRYIRSLGLDAYVVGGAVQDELLGIEHHDEDFLVPGVDQAGLRAALRPTGASRTWRCTDSSSASASTRATARSGRSFPPGSR